MLKTLRNQTIALAGLTQAVCLVRQIAKQGYADRIPLAASIRSILKTDAEDVLDVYGGTANISLGLTQLLRQLAQPNQVDSGVVRYASTLIFLERKLARKPEFTRVITAAIGEATIAAQKTDILDPDVIRILADAYQATLSTLKPRVLVAGEPMYLSDPENARLIRALLLAGIRSVVLWRQCGGARWRLLLLRPLMQREARELLAAT